MEYTAISFQIYEHVATITLNRPQAANAMDIVMAKELMHAAHACDTDDVRVVVITGTDNVFSVGGDLKSFSQQGDGISAHVMEVTTYFHNEPRSCV
jgi:2-(1,2-epoxy-1,2-dihydrophenyl)acetyl-CoA isomerase